MKNTASTVGIIPLAGMAKVLEDGARNNEGDLLLQMTPIFLKRWRGYQEQLQVFLNAEKASKPAAEFQEEITQIFQGIKVAAEDMDVDMLDEAVKKLEEYQFEAEQAELIDKVKTAIFNLDVEFLQEIEI